MVDADVECPNDYLLLNQKLSSLPAKVIFAKFPVLDKNKCNRCGLCAKKCRFNAIFAPKNKYPTFLHQLCVNCGLCWNLCPFNAIKVKKKIIGKIFENRINNNLYLITGQTVGIVDETGPIVRQTRQYALKLAQKLGIKKIIIDTAPGTHCNVINALLGVDESLAVTEPTPLGAHDLRLILALNKKLKIPTKIVLNQSDLGNERLISNVHYRIPYSKKISQAYFKGKLDKLSLKKLLLP